MIWSKEMCACQRIDIFQSIPVENQPDIHEMIADGIVVNGNFELPAGLETEDINNVGYRIRSDFDALDASKDIAGYKLASTESS